jgi:hypothetical protein
MVITFKGQATLLLSGVITKLSESEAAFLISACNSNRKHKANFVESRMIERVKV